MENEAAPVPSNNEGASHSSNSDTGFYQGVEDSQSVYLTELSGYLPNVTRSAQITKSTLDIPDFGIEFTGSERVKALYDAMKTHMQNNSSGDGPSMYDQLRGALQHVLRTNNKQGYQSFEQILPTGDVTELNRETENAPTREAWRKNALTGVDLLKVDGPLEDRAEANADEETGESKIPNLCRLYPYLKNAGIPRLISLANLSLINISLKKLLDADSKIQTIRFWGVINALKCDYYIAEADADPPDDEEPEEADKSAEEEEKEEQEIEGLENVPSTPKPMLKPLPQLVKESSGTGVNRKAYYAATSISVAENTWTRLPLLTPDQVVIARKINRGLTGDLKAKVSSFPAFPGSEAHLLHAQLVRISASTQICPVGYYTLDAEEEYDEDSPPPFNIMPNPEYRPPSFMQLSQPDMKYWMHYNQYILRQGRTSFYDAFEANRDEGEEEEDAEGEEELNQIRKPKYPVWYPEKADWYEPEKTVPPPLCSVINDSAVDGYPPWTILYGSKIFPNQSFVIARNNLWPGAYCIVCDQGRKFFNIYIGNGQKYKNQFLPVLPSHVKHEIYDPTLHEEVDPTPEEEEEIRKAAGLEEEKEDGEEEEEEDDK